MNRAHTHCGYNSLTKWIVLFKRFGHKTEIWLETENAAVQWICCIYFSPTDLHNFKRIIQSIEETKTTTQTFDGGWYCERWCPCISCEHSWKLFFFTFCYRFVLNCSFYWLAISPQQKLFVQNQLQQFYRLLYFQLKQRKYRHYTRWKRITNSFHACALAIASQATHIHARILHFFFSRCFAESDFLAFYFGIFVNLVSLCVVWGVGEESLCIYTCTVPSNHSVMACVWVWVCVIFHFDSLKRIILYVY